MLAAVNISSMTCNRATVEASKSASFIKALKRVRFLSFVCWNFVLKSRDDTSKAEEDSSGYAKAEWGIR